MRGCFLPGGMAGAVCSAPSIPSRPSRPCSSRHLDGVHRFRRASDDQRRGRRARTARSTASERKAGGFRNAANFIIIVDFHRRARLHLTDVIKPEGPKALARRLWDVWHSRDLDKLGDLIAEGHVNHDPNNPADLVGVKGYRELITLYTTMFSDLRFEIHDIVAEGDIVCSRWTSVGTHDGEVLGITPTGHSLKRTGMSWQRIERGKFVETWVERDGLGLARDIGAVPPA